MTELEAYEDGKKEGKKPFGPESGDGPSDPVLNAAWWRGHDGKPFRRVARQVAYVSSEGQKTLENKTCKELRELAARCFEKEASIQLLIHACNSKAALVMFLSRPEMAGL